MSRKKKKKNYRNEGKILKKSKGQAAESALRFPGIVTGVWAVLMLSVFPVIYSDYYFDILETKFAAFCIFTLGMIGLVLFWGIATGDIFRAAADTLRGWKRDGAAVWIRQQFSPADLCMIGFFLCSLIATFNAGPYVRQAVTGEEGRYVGMFYVALLTAAYFCVSRNLRFHRRYVTIFLWISMFVCIFGITDFYNMNLLHFRDGMREEQYAMFSSTIGNINTYTAYVGLVMALTGTLFVLSKEKLSRILFYFAAMAVSFLALLTGRSDNGYLTLAAFFGFLPLTAFRTRQGVRRYVISIAVFLAALLYMRQASLALGDRVLELDGLTKLIVSWKLLPCVAGLFSLLGAGLLFLDFRRRQNGEEPEISGVFRKSWIGFLLLAGAALLLLLLVVNRMTYEDALAAFGKAAEYLKFRDEWGTRRGYVWRAALEEYRALPALRMITGSGPDTFAIYMLIHRWTEMMEIAGEFFDSAHNEYLQYLFTIGPIGLLSYCGVMYATVRRLFRESCRREAAVKEPKAINEAGETGKIKRAEGRSRELKLKEAPYFCAFAYLIICYSAQATVNINIPIATPVLWVFVMISAAATRERDKD